MIIAFPCCLTSEKNYRSFTDGNHNSRNFKPGVRNNLKIRKKTLLYAVCVHTKLLQSCLTLCDPKVCSPPGFSVHGILQARTLEWVAMPSSRGSSWPRNWTCISYAPCVGSQFFTTSATGKPNGKLLYRIERGVLLTTSWNTGSDYPHLAQLLHQVSYHIVFIISSLSWMFSYFM